MYRFLFVVIILAFSMAPALAQETPALAQETPALAQETKSHFEYNKDHFLAGSTVVQGMVGVDDLFMAGETVRSEQGITGSAHLAGREVISNGAIGGDAYIAGMEVSLKGKVAGDVTVGGYNVIIGEVGGDLRASGANLTLTAPVLGYALVSGDEVNFNSVVKGDVSVAAEEVDFSGDARIEGKLIIYEEKTGATVVPAHVISEDRVERRDLSEWSEDGLQAGNRGNSLVGFLKRVLFLTVLAVLIAAIRPQKLADLRRSVLGQPLRNLLFGFLAVSVGIGAAILLMFTGLGFLLVLASLLIALLIAFTGFVVGTYAVGVGLLQLVKGPEPDNTRTRIFAAVVGAFAVSIIALIPYLGWLFVLAVALIGGGSITVRLFRPQLLMPK